MAMDNGASSYRRFRENGDESGLVEIIRDYKDGLIFFLNSFVRDINIAEELAEDTFVLLGTKKPRDKNKGSFKTWLYTIGRNVAIDYLRKRKRNREVSLEEGVEISYDQNIECNYLRKERDLIIHRSMQRLKPEYRQVLWLIYFENLAYKECAFIMKKTVHGIETLAYRARLALKSELEQEEIYFEDI